MLLPSLNLSTAEILNVNPYLTVILGNISSNLALWRYKVQSKHSVFLYLRGNVNHTCVICPRFLKGGQDKTLKCTAIAEIQTRRTWIPLKISNQPSHERCLNCCIPLHLSLECSGTLSPIQHSYTDRGSEVRSGSVAAAIVTECLRRPSNKQACSEELALAYFRQNYWDWHDTREASGQKKCFLFAFS